MHMLSWLSTGASKCCLVRFYNGLETLVTCPFYTITCFRNEHSISYIARDAKWLSHACELSSWLSAASPIFCSAQATEPIPEPSMMPPQAALSKPHYVNSSANCMPTTTPLTAYVLPLHEPHQACSSQSHTLPSTAPLSIGDTMDETIPSIDDVEDADAIAHRLRDILAHTPLSDVVTTVQNTLGMGLLSAIHLNAEGPHHGRPLFRHVHLSPMPPHAASPALPTTLAAISAPRQAANTTAPHPATLQPATATTELAAPTVHATAPTPPAAPHAPAPATAALLAHPTPVLLVQRPRKDPSLVSDRTIRERVLDVSKVVGGDLVVYLQRLFALRKDLFASVLQDAVVRKYAQELLAAHECILSDSAALALKFELGLSDSQYTVLRKRLHTKGDDVLPPLSSVVKKKTRYALPQKS